MPFGPNRSATPSPRIGCPWIPVFVLAASPALAEDSSCFDLSTSVDTPRRDPIERIEGRGRGRDHSQHGTYETDVDWASTRAVIELPFGETLAKFLDYRNVKDMDRTELQVRAIDVAGYFAVRQLDVDVTIKALFLKFHIKWTEEWAYRVVAGSDRYPEVVVINYQKIAGSRHIRHQCGSYVLRRLGPDATDVAMYEEIRAKRRSSKDTSAMHAGILRNIRQDRWPTPPVRRNRAAIDLPTQAQEEP